jgi:hypothetical protein
LNTFAAVALSFAALIRIPDIRRDWRAEPDDPRFAMRSYWPWGVISWQGVRRLTIPSEIGVICLAGGLLSSGLLTVFEAVFFLVAIPLAISIFFVNWPKFVVPPALRTQSGAVAAYRERTIR